MADTPISDAVGETLDYLLDKMEARAARWKAAAKEWRGMLLGIHDERHALIGKVGRLNARIAELEAQIKGRGGAAPNCERPREGGFSTPESAESHPAPVCQTCGGSGEVRGKALCVDKYHTIYEAVPCPGCDGKGGRW